MFRLGSDVLDKARNVTQKCVIVKICLFLEDGSESQKRYSLFNLSLRLRRSFFWSTITVRKLKLWVPTKLRLKSRLAQLNNKNFANSIFFSDLQIPACTDAPTALKTFWLWLTIFRSVFILFLTKYAHTFYSCSFRGRRVQKVVSVARWPCPPLNKSKQAVKK
jgi:hypothetical protein